jgi:hypothetical protein
MDLTASSGSAPPGAARGTTVQGRRPIDAWLRPAARLTDCEKWKERERERERERARAGHRWALGRVTGFVHVPATWPGNDDDRDEATPPRMPPPSMEPCLRW